MLGRFLTKSARPLAVRRLFAEAAGPASRELASRDTRAQSIASPKMQYINNELVPVTYLVLRTRQSIEDYVMKTVKDYFRTTHRNALTLTSDLSNHGLDSLDTVEIAMTVEADLGYLIASENLPAFQKPIHYVNYIEQVENFKVQYGKDPLP